MIRTLLLTFAALTLTTAPALAQMSFHGYVPHTDIVPTPKTNKRGDAGNWYNGDEFKLRLLTLEFGQKTKAFFPPASALIVPGSGTIPNSEFLRGALSVMGFEAPSSPYVLLDDLTHKTVELYAFDDVLGFIETQPDGTIFIIGLDFHSGFIRKDQDGITFVHTSNNSKGIIREPIKDSLALKDSQIFIIGDLSDRARIVLGVDAI